MRRRTVLATTLVLALFAAPRPPAAHAARLDTAAIQALLDQADRAFEEARYDDALGKYRASRAAGAPPEAVYMEARCHQEMERWREAREAFLDYLAQDDLDPEGKGRAEMALRVVADRLATGTLVIQVSPFGAAVTIDGEPAGSAPLAPLDLRPGPHEVLVEAPGCEPLQRSVTIEGGERTQLAIELRAVPPGPAATPEPQPEPPPRPSYSPWTWITLGTGAAVLVAGTVSYALGEEDHRRIVDAEGYGSEGPTRLTQRAALDLEASGDRKKLAGYALWGVGGAALAASTVLFVLDATRDPRDGSVHVTLSPTDDGGFLSLGGRF
jgi:hypothetical protein